MSWKPVEARKRAPNRPADARALRASIAACLAGSPPDEQRLREQVWTYVGTEREAGASPGRVIMALTGILEAARIVPSGARQDLTRRVILWCVEAYFGHLGGDVHGREDEALSDAPAASR